MGACGFAEEALSILVFSLVLISSGFGWFYVCYLFRLVSCGGSLARRLPGGINMVHQRVQGDTVVVWGSHLFVSLRHGFAVCSRVVFLRSLSFECLLVSGHKCCNGSKGEEKVETLLSTSINRNQTEL
ncbi:unnamed protein product [Brassica oleracea]